MKYISTRGKAPALTFSEALIAGLASDGGLYVPETFPEFRVKDFSPNMTWQQVAIQLLKPFLTEDFLGSEIEKIVTQAFRFPLPLVPLSDHLSLLELFHGPTAAFKDVGARFLAECLERLDHKKRTVLVATSGDTGGAVASAFYEKKNIDVIILFPKGLVSPFQEKQLTCWGKNIRAFGVNGTFDDCQRMVKEAFQNTWWQKNKNLMSANSINIARILPQTTYYAWASLAHFFKSKRIPGFVIPTGNLGHAIAALWVQKMGFPIKKVVVSTNANISVVNYFENGEWKPRPTVSTLANAMDVGNASNMERLIQLFPKRADLLEHAAAYSISDDEIRKAIKEANNKWGQVICPHTATAFAALKYLSPEYDWILVATAHAAKFQSVVEPIIGDKVLIPKVLENIADRPSHLGEIGPNLTELQSQV